MFMATELTDGPDFGFSFSSLEGWQLVLVVIAMIAMFGVLLGGVAYSTLKAAHFPPPIALVVVLTSVTLSMVSVYLVTRDPELLTLAGMGLGALSGAVASAWGQNKDDDDD